jgi:formate-dependent nitrite reductase membrane component NrfD
MLIELPIRGSTIQGQPKMISDDLEMAETNACLVGDSFKLGYRFQRYWDTSMALAFFFAEVGTGIFLVSFFLEFVPGMIAGLAITGTLKPYFHLAHMGVPKKSWRAILRPDRSWISRGAIAIGVLIGFGALYIIDLKFGAAARLGLPLSTGRWVGYFAVAGAMTVMCYQGMAMSASEAFTLWASALLPISSFSYALTAGVMVTLVAGWNVFDVDQRMMLSNLAIALLVIDAIIVLAILSRASVKSNGGKFSVNLLTRGEYARYFIGLVPIVGLLAPVSVLAIDGGRWMTALAAAMMLTGFFAFRLLMFKAAVFEPITHDLAGSIGLPPRSST